MDKETVPSTCKKEKNVTNIMNSKKTQKKTKINVLTEIYEKSINM